MKIGCLHSMVAMVILILIGTSPQLKAQSDDLHELSDKNGRSIRARIVMVTGEEVEIKMDNGRSYTLPIAQFSLSSQALIRKHGGSTPKPPTRSDDPQPEQQTPVTKFSNDPIFEFNGLKFKERDLDHFKIRTIDTKNDPADRYAEKIYDQMVEIIPTLTAIFEEQGFRAPGEDPNANDFPDPDKQFRHVIYLVEEESESGPYSEMVNQYAKLISSDESRDRFVKSSMQTGNFSDSKRRFTVIRKQPNRPAQQLLAHMVAIQLVGSRAEQQSMPLWLNMGAGYYSEHELFKKCTVHYIDFSNYYDDYEGAGGNEAMTKSETLSNSEPWTKPLKALCKNNKRVSLERLFAAAVVDLTPNDSAYAMALFSFMNSTPEMTIGFNKFLDQLKQGNPLSPQGLAEIFGHETTGAFEQAWYAYIMSTKFR